jgi:hypothetical protein
MKYLKRFNENLSIYDKSWESLLPSEIWVIKGGDGKHKFTKGNIMLNADMLQITYDNPEPVIPDTLEFDIYFSKLDEEISGDSTLVKSFGSVQKIDSNYTGPIRLNVDITYGDLVACEFSIDKKDGVKLIQDTTYGSKFDPSNTVFAFDKDSLLKIVEFLSKFNHGVRLKLEDFKFLSE